MSERQIARKKAAAVTPQEAEDVRQLQEFDDFAKFSEDDLKRIVKASHRTSTSGPWPLIREQTVSDACYILLTGEAGVFVGQDKIATVKSGEVIGESALKRGKLRGATVTTTGRAEVLPSTAMTSTACSTMYPRCVASSMQRSRDASQAGAKADSADVRNGGTSPGAGTTVGIACLTATLSLKPTPS